MSQQQQQRQQWHGKVGNHFGDWENPVQTFFSSKGARPEYTDIASHEYHEVPTVLDQKVGVLVEFLTRATHCVAYTGAGLSVPSGLDDYATARRSGSRPEQERGAGLIARPSVGHEVLTRLHLAGYLFEIGHTLTVTPVGVSSIFLNTYAS